LPTLCSLISTKDLISRKKKMNIKNNMLTDGMEEERQATAIFYPMGACLAFSSPLRYPFLFTNRNRQACDRKNKTHNEKKREVVFPVIARWPLAIYSAWRSSFCILMTVPWDTNLPSPLREFNKYLNSERSGDRRLVSKGFCVHLRLQRSSSYFQLRNR